jgi:hypothetical protein
MPSFGAARDFFCAECELDHICPRRDRPLCGSPDGVSQFQCPGLARSLAVYCADGLVLSRTGLIHAISLGRPILAGW